MPAKSRKRKTYKLGVDSLKTNVRKSIKKANTALRDGQKAVQRARRNGDTKAEASNVASLNKNRWVLRNLNATLSALMDACPDQLLNSDPTYEG